MKVHEYQAKEILRGFGVPVPEGRAARTSVAAIEGAEAIGGSLWVVKSQIHAGGRGKGRFAGQVSDASLAMASAGDEASEGKGGVRLARTLEEVGEHAGQMLGQTLVTKQTGIGGQAVRTVYVESGCRIARELYLGILLDRSTNRVLVMASTEGGMDIEDVAEQDPGAIKKVTVDPGLGLVPYQARTLAFALGMKGREVRSASKFLISAYEAYMGTDCSMLEVNPMVVTEEGEVMALDAKMTFDDNALFRHAEIESLRDEHEEDASELEAQKWNLSYVKLDGNIGCMVNGAGLAMATMDIIQFKGAEPANFLDVGGGAQQEQVAAAFRIITDDPAVKGILVNIFGGIMKCDVIAEGVVAAVKEVGLNVPLVVRLSGTNAELGKEILAQSGLAITPTSNLDEAADAIVRAVRG